MRTLVLSTAACLVLAAPLAAQRTPKVLWKIPIQSNSYGGGAVADVDGDGRLEVAFASYFGDSKVRVLNGEDGSLVWAHDAGRACLDASLRFDDVNGDGTLDLVVPISNTCRVHAFDAKTGDEIWTYETGGGDCIDSPPAIIDADGDGTPDVVFGSFKNRLHVVNARTGKGVRKVTVAAPPSEEDGETANPKKARRRSNFIQTGPIVMDVNGDGTADFIAGTFKGDNRLYARDGKTGDVLWHHAFTKSIGMYHGPAVGDLDGDQIPDLVQTAYDGHVVALRAKDGKVLWDVAPGDRYYMAPAAIADIDKDGKLEVIAVSNRLTVIEHNGKIKYSERLTTGWGGAHRGASIADLDGDGRLDIAYLLDDGTFGVRRGKDGKLLYELKPDALTDQKVSSNSHGPVIADLDDDGRLDVFYVIGKGSSANEFKGNWGLAVCLTGFKGKATAKAWPMLRHDAHNTGNWHTPLSPTLRKNLEQAAAKTTRRKRGV